MQLGESSGASVAMGVFIGTVLGAVNGYSGALLIGMVGGFLW